MSREPTGTDKPAEHRTVLDDERDLVLEKRGGARRPGFALAMKSCTRHGRFPRGRAEFSDEAVEFCIPDQGRSPCLRPTPAPGAT